MSVNGDDAVPDREELRHTAARRNERGWWLVAALMVAVLLVTPLAALLGSGDPLSGEAVAIALVPLAVGLVVGGMVLLVMRRREPDLPLLLGADRGTRRAVWRAIRTGHAPDARIDALAREKADRIVRNSWLIVFYAILSALQILLLSIGIGRSEGVWEIALSAMTAACWATALIWSIILRARGGRYLDHGPR